jgi:enoyl-CoA hydratase/carnithine racemase
MSTAASTETVLAPAAPEPVVLREEKGGIVRLTMNRPGAYNALSMALMTGLQDAFDAIAEDPTVRVVILRGAGKGFCAGHDLRELRSDTSEAFYHNVFATCSKLMLSIQRLPQPVIAEVHGTATAAGCQLVATCDLAVATEDARFGTPGVNIGLFCSTPMVAVSRAVPRKQVMKMLLTGEIMDAATAVTYGLINEAVPPASLAERTREIAATIAGKSPLTLEIGKRAFYEQAEMAIADAYLHTSEVMTRNMLARDAAEGIDAFIEKRPPEWTGA